MADSVEDIQASYIAALRSLQPALAAWWETMVERHGEDGVWARWPTGPSGHPRVLAIFREHWFAIEALNDRALEGPQLPDRPEEELWGEDDEEEDPEFHDQADWLIHSIGDEAPELESLVAGLCFVPIGEDLDEEPA